MAAALCLSLAVTITTTSPAPSAQNARALEVLVAIYGSGPQAELASNYVNIREGQGQFQLEGYAMFWRELSGELTLGERRFRDVASAGLVSAVVSGDPAGLPAPAVREIHQKMKLGTIALVAVVPAAQFAQARKVIEETGPRHMVAVTVAAQR